MWNTVALTDPSGAISTTYTYAPFGDTAAIGSPNPNPFQFTGRENDGTGLYYYRARYYDPVLSRFISEDPESLDGGDVSLYSYVFNSPVDVADPGGEMVPLPLVWQSAPAISGRKDSSSSILRDLQCDPKSWIVETGVVSIRAVGASRLLSKGIQKKLGDLTGVYPKKVGGGGKLVPYDPVTGRYVRAIPRSESIAAQFSIGLSQGNASGKSGAPPPPAVSSAQAWGQAIGQILGSLF